MRILLWIKNFFIASPEPTIYRYQCFMCRTEAVGSAKVVKRKIAFHDKYCTQKMVMVNHV